MISVCEVVAGALVADGKWYSEALHTYMMAEFHKCSVSVTECEMLLVHTAPEKWQTAHDVSVRFASTCQVSDTFKEFSVE